MVNDKAHQDLISWGTTGESFIIYNSKNFSKRVLPEHFKHGNFSSFVRQLNMYVIYTSFTLHRVQLKYLYFLLFFLFF